MPHPQPQPGVPHFGRKSSIPAPTPAKKQHFWSDRRLRKSLLRALGPGGAEAGEEDTPANHHFPNPGLPLAKTLSPRRWEVKWKSPQRSLSWRAGPDFLHRGITWEAV